VYEAGVHVRTVVTREVEWDNQQQGWVLALAEWRAGLCHRCLGELDETADPAMDPNNREGTHRYESKPPKRCHRCTALMASEATYHATSKQTGEYVTPHPGALIHQVVKVPRRRG
jgi:hypothetical protein